MRAPRSNRSTRTISCTNWIDVRVSGAMVVVNRVTPAPRRARRLSKANSRIREIFWFSAPRLRSSADVRPSGAPGDGTCAPRRSRTPPLLGVSIDAAGVRVSPRDKHAGAGPRHHPRRARPAGSREPKPSPMAVVPSRAHRSRRADVRRLGERGRRGRRRNVFARPLERPPRPLREAHPRRARATHRGPDRAVPRFPRPTSRQAVRAPRHREGHRRRDAVPVRPRQLQLRRIRDGHPRAHRGVHPARLPRPPRAPRGCRRAAILRPHAHPRGRLRHRKRARRLPIHRGARHRLPRGHLRHRSRFQTVRSNIRRCGQVDAPPAVAIHRRGGGGC